MPEIHHHLEQHPGVNTGEFAVLTKKAVPGGLLIAFEGVDGAGKSTQAKMACEKLGSLGFDAITLREPTTGPIGQKLRQLMVAGRVEPLEEFRLFLADREENVRLNIRPALERGAVICIDRYYISSMAYQGALGLDPGFIQAENEKIAPRPNLILHFRVPVEQSLARIIASRREGQNLFELQAYQEKVCELFETFKLPGLVHCDARQPIETLHEEVMEKIRPLLPKSSKQAMTIG